MRARTRKASKMLESMHCLLGCSKAEKYKRYSGNAMSAGRKESAPNFSRVDTSLSAAQLKARFPLFKQELSRALRWS